VRYVAQKTGRYTGDDATERITEAHMLLMQNEPQERSGVWVNCCSQGRGFLYEGRGIGVCWNSLKEEKDVIWVFGKGRVEERRWDDQAQHISISTVG